MKKNQLKLVTLLCGICLLIFACRKDLKSLLGDQPAPESAVLTSAKSWQLNEVQKFPAKLKKTTLQPRWTQAWTMKTSAGKPIMVVPTREVSLTNKSFSIRRFYIFDMNGNNITSGKIVEILGDNNYDVSDHLDQLLPNLQKNNIPGFTGAIMEYNLNYRRRGGVAFENGIRTNKAVAIARGNNMRFAESNYSNASVGGRPLKVNNMWFLGTYVKDECMYRITTNSIGDIIKCEEVSCPPPEPETASTASASAADPGTLPGGILPEVIISGGVAPKRRFNLLMLDNLCFDKIINYLLDKNAYYQVLTKPFTEENPAITNVNKQPTLNMKPVSNLAYPAAGITGRATLGYTNYHTGSNTADIDISQQMLDNASRILIYAALVHETLHAYIRLQVDMAQSDLATGPLLKDMNSWTELYGVPTGFVDHLAMMEYSLEATIGIIKELDNYQPNSNLALRQAEEKKYILAALYGLDQEGMDVPGEAILNTVYNSIMTKYGITAQEAKDFYRDNVNVTDATKKLPKGDVGCPR